MPLLCAADQATMKQEDMEMHEKPAYTVIQPLLSVRLAAKVAASTPASSELRHQYARALVEDAKARAKKSLVAARQACNRG